MKSLHLSDTYHGSAGRHGDDSLEAYIRVYPEEAFLRLFRMHRASFWQLVELLANAGGLEYWPEPGKSRAGKPPRPNYHQIAAGLYILGGGGRTVADSQVTL